jgi:hypothetical protein
MAIAERETPTRIRTRRPKMTDAERLNRETSDVLTQWRQRNLPTEEPPLTFRDEIRLVIDDKTVLRVTPSGTGFQLGLHTRGETEIEDERGKKTVSTDQEIMTGRVDGRDISFWGAPGPGRRVQNTPQAREGYNALLEVARDRMKQRTKKRTK